MRNDYTDRGREDELRELMHRQILILDGGMGTMLQVQNLTAEDFGGVDLEGCNENLILTRPQAMSKPEPSAMTTV
jgi:5-methyltetrahydrofolate--homocysteine methyltransferase